MRNLEFNNSKCEITCFARREGKLNIMKDTSEVDTTASKFHFKLRSFKIKGLIWRILTKRAICAIIKNLNHTTSGDFTADSSLLVTHTTIDSLTFTMDKIDYISKANVLFDADINANLNDMIFHLVKIHHALMKLRFHLKVG